MKQKASPKPKVVKGVKIVKAVDKITISRPKQKIDYSKIIIAVVVITLPFLGFYFGFAYKNVLTEIEVNSGIDEMIQEALDNDSDNSRWDKYRLPALNLQLSLPKLLSDFEIEVTEYQGDVLPDGRFGYVQCLKVTDFADLSGLVGVAYASAPGCWSDVFGVGATSLNFSAPRGAGFSDGKGYRVELDQNGQKQYYATTFDLMDRLPIPADLVLKEYTNQYGVTMLVTRGANESVDSPFPVLGTPGEGFIGATIKTNNQEYPFAYVWMKLTDDLTQDLFLQIIDTIEL